MPGKVNTIDAHPKRNAIIDNILAGESLVSISNRFSVSKQALSRFKAKVLRPAIAQRHVSRSQQVAAQSTQDALSLVSDIKALIPPPSTFTPTASLLERKWARYDRLSQKAEDAGDLKAWASIDRSETAALQLRAQLSGEIQPQVQGNVQVAILIPSPSAHHGQGQVIEVHARQEGLQRASNDGDSEAGEGQQE